MRIKEISKYINANAREKGFWDGNPNTGEKLMLVVSELSEALEADRKGRVAQKGLFRLEYDDAGMVVGESELRDKVFKHAFESHIKDSFEDELADAAIRIFDLAFQFDIDLEWHIEQKHRYNLGREKMHGKKY